MTRTRTNARPEAALLHACMDLLRFRGVLAIRTNSGSLKVGGRLIRLAPAGTSDVLGALPGGRFLALETKASGGRLTEAQDAFLAAVREAGGVAVVIRDLRRLEAVLAALAIDPTADIELEDI